MNISIVGAGHVGVVYATGFAELGHRVTVVDTHRGRIAGLKAGRIWFHEPGLAELLARCLRRRRVRFTSSYADALSGADFVFVCVPTPATDDGGLDDSYLRDAFTRIRDSVGTPRPIVVNKSTAPVGTGDMAAKILESAGMQVVSNPEFLAEGRAVEDFRHPSRVLIGARDRGAAEAVAALYAPFGARVVIADPTTAELTKVAANSFLAMKVSFANVLAQIAVAVGADGAQVVEGLSLDPRIGRGHLQAGLGFGGSCLPKDLAAMEHLARRFASPGLFSAAAEVNRAQRQRVLDWLMAKLGSLAGKRIALLGASFKASTDDTQASPGLLLAESLTQLHALVIVFDPAVRLRVDRPAGIRSARSARAAARNSDALVVATEWPEFAALDLRILRREMRGNVLVDGRGILDADAARACGFEFFSLAGERAG